MLFPSLVLSFLRLKSDGPSACLTLRFSPGTEVLAAFAGYNVRLYRTGSSLDFPPFCEPSRGWTVVSLQFSIILEAK